MALEYAGTSPILNEEAELGSRRPPVLGFKDDLLDEEPQIVRQKGGDVTAILEKLVAERRAILNDERFNPREKLRLLESNRQTLVLVSGGTIKKTENVVYSILIFGASVIVVLALLTVFGGLPAEVTLTFVGTVLGGTIATIAQKLGKI